MKRLHIFLACLMIMCISYVVLYENIVWPSNASEVWQFLYKYCICQGIACGIFVCYTGLSLYRHKIDTEK